MSNIQTGAERMPHDLSHLGFLAGQIGRLITISTTPVIAGDSFEMDVVGLVELPGEHAAEERAADRGAGTEGPAQEDVVRLPAGTLLVAGGHPLKAEVGDPV